MKVVILAGGFGTRISEECDNIPKPMITIGEKPIIWHIMKIYSSFGFNDFIICCGYKAYVIKEYFSNYFLHNSNITFNLRENNFKVHDNNSEPWNVTLVDTGLNTMTGGRIKQIKDFIENDENFMMTYGDGVANIDIDKLLDLHINNNKIATLTAVNIGQKFGVLDVENNTVMSFREKSKADSEMINGGFMVLNKKIFNYISSNESIFEIETLNRLCEEKELIAYKHSGFWKCMDTQRDRKILEELWDKEKPPWRSW